MSTENDGSGSNVVIPAGTEKNLFGSTQGFKTEQPAAAPDASKGGETTQAKTDQGGTAVTFADLAAKKGFKTSDDLAKAYAELEVHATKKSMELSDLVTAKAEGVKTAADAHQGNGNSSGKSDYTPDEALALVRSLITSEVAPIRERLAIADTFKEPGDMQFAPAVAELVRNNPNIPWDVALKSVKFDAVAGKVTAFDAQKIKETNDLKDKAQAGSQNQRIAPDKNLAGMVADKNIPFKEVQKAMREAFSQ